MVGISKEVVSLIYYLLPGFLAAWIFYGLTAHPKKSPFERAVQALIFTTIIRGFVVAVREVLVRLDHWVSFGQWSEDIALVWSLLVAVFFGHLLALVANKNWYHQLLHWLRITERTSYPSEWYSTFARHKRYAVLHLHGQRRLYGWVFEWPDQSDAGHFAITEPEWALDDNTRVPVYLDQAILIPATEVEMVEFLKFPKEVDVSQSEIDTSRERLVSLKAAGVDHPEPTNGKMLSEEENAHTASNTIEV